MTTYRKETWIIWRAIAVVLIGILGASTMSVAGEPDGAGWVSKIVSIQGTVRVRRHGQTLWQPVQLNDTFFVGDQIHVEVNSRAGIVLSNDALMRLDQNSFLIFTEIKQKQTFIFKLLEGAANFFSHRPRSLRILTPFVNGVIEGTEFFVQVDSRQTRIELFEGRILAQNDQGMLELAKGYGAVAQAGNAPQRYLLVRPRESVQWAMYYPPVLALEPGMLSADVKSSLALFNDGQFTEALAQLESIRPETRDATFYTCRAAMRLHVGRIAQAQSDIEHALSMNAQNGDALALKAVIAVVQNQAAEAVDLARQAVQHSPRSVSAHIAQSYALQAQFKLSEALGAAQDAVTQAPDSGLAWARLAEMHLSVGDLDKGVNAARKAVELAPRTAHAHTILGFAHLTRIDTRKARESFKEAIGLDSAAPLPRLGLGLAVIRDGALALGRSEIEIAAGLDPGNSLIRSYLGKVYFDEKRNPQDGQQFEIAKVLDPNDPTPWFYDALRKQSLNRPVEALQDLQQSIVLNDNRAVYRSRFLLDQDLAARNANLGRIYSDLGFEELAAHQAYQSLNADPTNQSAHQLLADTYGARPRHEIARVSEQLQAKLLQPLNINPVQPQVGETYTLSNENAIWSRASLNEYNPLFARDRFAAQISGAIGNDDTLSDEISISALKRKFSMNVGQFHYETDGFRQNNDFDQNLYSAFVQAAVTTHFNLQAEYRKKRTKHGDLDIYWDLFDPDTYYRLDSEEDTWRAGVHYQPYAAFDIIGSLIHQKKDTKESGMQEWSGNLYERIDETDEEGIIGEIQFIYHASHVNAVLGGGSYDLDRETVINSVFPIDSDVKHNNGYLYSQISYPENLTLTVGASLDKIDDELRGDNELLSPKIGITWNPILTTTLRLSYFKSLKRPLIADQSIEPTQVAGFNQFFDDWNGTESKNYAVAIEQQFFKQLSGGGTFVRRDLKRPRTFSNIVLYEDWDEDTFGAYLYWVLDKNIALKAEYEYENFKRELNDLSESAPVEMTTHICPLSVVYFHPSGFSGRIKGSYVNQEVKRPSQTEKSENDDFITTDIALGYRLPNRYGMLSAEIKNVFDESFNYVGADVRSPRFDYFPDYIPSRTYVVRLSLTF